MSAFDVFARDHGVVVPKASRGRPTKPAAKVISVRLSPAGAKALADVEDGYRRAGVAAYSRNQIIERAIINHVDDAVALAANIARWRDDNTKK